MIQCSACGKVIEKVPDWLRTAASVRRPRPMRPEGHGVDPDIAVEDDPSQLAKGTDPQLQRAIQEVTTRMRALPPRPAHPPYEKRVPDVK